MFVVEKLLSLFLELLLPLLAGYLLKRWRRLKPKTVDHLMKCNIYLFFPLLGVLSIWGMKLNMDLIWLPILGVIMQVVPGILAFILVKKRFTNPLEQGSYILASMLSNRGTVGLLSVYLLFGEEGYVLGRLIMLFNSFVIYLVGYPLAQYFYQKGSSLLQGRVSWKNLFLNRTQLPVLGVLIGLLVNVTGLPRPQSVKSLVDLLIRLSAWTSLLPIGYAMDFAAMKDYYLKTMELLGIKFILTPALTLLLGRLVISDAKVLWTVCILSLAPTAINAVVAAKINNINYHLPMASLITTTLVYLLVVFPIILISL
ncbi:MAG: transporter [Firmicutes bacterium]|nr:transporter [Bacillota bacterium]